MRLDIDPATKILTYLDSQGNVYELDKASGKGKVVYSHREIGGADYVMGMAFGPDRVLYVFGNESQGAKNRCIVRRVVREGPARQWVTLAQTEWYPEERHAVRPQLQRHRRQPRQQMGVSEHWLAHRPRRGAGCQRPVPQHARSAVE